MVSAVRLARGIDDPKWHPQEPFIVPAARYPGVSFGYLRFCVTNSQPSIQAQLRKCLRHYHKEVKGRMFVAEEPVNFVTGRLEDWKTASLDPVGGCALSRSIPGLKLLFPKRELQSTSVAKIVSLPARL